MPDILTTLNRSTWKTEVRIKLIGKDDSTVIPDATLTSLVDMAERLLKKKITTWATVLATGGDNKEYLIDAAVSQLCAMLCTPLRNQVPISTTDGDTQIMSSHTTKMSVDWNKLETSLYGEVSAYLSLISTFSSITVTRVGVITRDPAMFEDLND